MGVASRATARPLAEPARSPSRARTRPLRVVEAPRRRASGTGIALTAALVVAVLFSVVAFHTLLVQNQSELDRLDREIDAARARQQQLVLLEAQLSAPERIVQVAESDLGMVTPTEVVWLEPVTELPGAPSSAPEGGPSRR